MGRRRGDAEPRGCVMSAVPPESTPSTQVLEGSDGDSGNERLTQSRERISVWLADEDRAAKSPAAPDIHAAPSQDERRHPVVAIAIDVLSEWWRQHPLRASASLAGTTARQAIVPLVRRHPIAVLGVAAISGAVLVRTRAWRWVLRPAVVAGVAAQIAAQVMSRVATLPTPRDPDVDASQRNAPGGNSSAR